MIYKSKWSAFWDGWASVFDYCGVRHFSVPDPSKGFERDREALARDARSIAGDWQAVGKDMWGVFNTISAELAHAK